MFQKGLYLSKISDNNSSICCLRFGTFISKSSRHIGQALIKPDSQHLEQSKWPEVQENIFKGASISSMQTGHSNICSCSLTLLHRILAQMTAHLLFKFTMIPFILIKGRRQRDTNLFNISFPNLNNFPMNSTNIE